MFFDVKNERKNRFFGLEKRFEHVFAIEMTDAGALWKALA